MELTVTYLRSQFAVFNADYFGGKLPVPHFAVSNSRTMLGQFRCLRRRKSPFGKCVTSGYTIKVSEYYDMPEREYHNVLLHEMIHYYIAYSGVTDTSPHGKVFRKLMGELNECGWNISVSTSTRKWAVAEHNRKRCRIVLAAVTSDERYFLSVVNRGYVKYIDSLARQSPAIKSHEWFVSDDDMFIGYPASRSLRGQLTSKDKFNEIVSMLNKTKEMILTHRTKNL